MKNFMSSFLFISVMFLNSCGGGGSTATTVDNIISDINSTISDDNTVADKNNTTADDTTNTTTNDDNITKDDSNTTTNSGIYIAKSSESTKDIYKFFNHPILYNDKVYTRLFRLYSFNVDTGMKVVEYDLSKFTSDTSLDTLLTKEIYANTQSAENTNSKFNQRYYNLLEMDNSLYFSILPTNKDLKSQSGRIKYDLTSKNIDYTILTDPLLGENYDKTFDLTIGWFMPFNSNQYIAIIEEALAKVIYPDSGASYKYGGRDYLSEGADSKDYSDGVPPVATNSSFIFASQKIYSVKVLADEAYVKYGARDYNGDPEYIESDVLEDFKALYTGTKEYRLANYGGDMSGLGTPELILDGDYVYNIAKLTYDNIDGNRMNDLYLLKYDLKANLKEIQLLEEGTDVFNLFFAYQPYKYGDNIIFKFAKSDYNYIYSYNLSTNKYNFKIQIGTKELAGYMKRDTAVTSYIITGDTIILPEFVMSKTQVKYSTYMDLVFKVLDINTGSVIKTLTHPYLENMRHGDDSIGVTSSLSNDSSVYFFAEKYTKTAVDKLIIKIDSPDNRVQKSKYRMDNQHTGVITDK